MHIPVFSSWSLHKKLVLIIMLSCAVCLLISLSVLVASSATATYKDSLQGISGLADVLAENGQAALAFSDKTESQRLLDSLKDHHEIKSAWLITDNGTILASWQQKGGVHHLPRAYQVATTQLHSDFWERRADLYHPVRKNNELIGYILLQADFTEQWSQQVTNLTMALGGAVLALVVVFLLATRLQRVISQPIKELADTARTIADDKAYGLRVPQHTDDEIGDLVRDFNRMLCEIQIRDENLIRHSAQLEEEVAKRTAELRQAKEEAEAASHSKGEFLAHMSHEIRTPLNGVLGFLKLLSRTQLTDQQHDYLHSINLSARTLLAVINDILDFSKIEAGKLSIEKIDFNLRETIEETVSMFAVNAEDKGIELLCVIDKEVPVKLIGDPSRLTQVLTNLLDNAIKFTERGEVRVTVYVHEESDSDVSLQISVIDTGIGIAEGALKKLFQPFNQADSSTTRKYGGTGLGLIITKRIIEMCGGSIEAESHIGQGTIFNIHLRLQKQPGVSDYQPLSEIMGHLNILVVTPNPGVAQGLAEIFSVWGITSQTASNAAAALSLLNDNADTSRAFQAVIYDHATPDATSQEFAAHVKSGSNFGKVSLLLLGNLSTCQNFEELTQEGYARCIKKPAKSSELYNALARLFIHPEAIPQHKIFSNVKLKPLLGRHVLIVDDNDINRRLAQLLVRELGGEFDSAENGVQAVEACKQRTYDAILMDINMPVMDGIEATKHIRELEAGNGHTPIIALTANALTGDKERFIEAGMDEYLSKPINENMLLSLLNKYFPNQNEPLTPNVAEMPDKNITDISTATENELPALDPQLGIESSFGSSTIWHTMLEMMLEQLPSYADRLNRAAEDIAELKQISHKLAGTCSYCGVPALDLAARRLEANCQTDEIASVRNALLNLQQQIERVRRLDQDGKLRGSSVQVY